jgi:hypothetical protein
MGFDGVGDDKLLGVLHEIVKENKGKELVFESFKSPPFVDVNDMEVSPLHMIFDLKGVPCWEGVF